MNAASKYHTHLTLHNKSQVRGKDVKDLTDKLPSMVKAIEKHADKQNVVCKLVQAMNSLALNDTNCRKIADSGGSATVLRALDHAYRSGAPQIAAATAANMPLPPDLATVIVQCLKLISRFAMHDVYKRTLCEQVSFCL